MKLNNTHSSLFALFLMSLSWQIVCNNIRPRPSSFPYISGDTFRTIADFIIDETNATINPHQVKDGDIIFLKTDLLDYFFINIHPHLTSKYILITHNSDYSAPAKYAYMLDDQKLIAWFAQNADLSHHSKLIPIPIGIANPYWAHGNIHVLNHLIPQISTVTKNTLMYLNITPQNNPNARNPVIQLFANKSFCQNIASFKPWSEYLKDLAQSKFVISPHGNGLDAHRTWEALCMGSFPIVKTSTLDAMYKDLPVVIVDDWTDVTEAFLVTKLEEFNSKIFNKEKIWASYWINEIKKLQKNYRG